MSRDLTAAARTATQQEVVRPVAFVEMDFSGGFVRANSTPYTLSFDADNDTVDEDFLGVGNLGNISEVSEGADTRARSITLTLSGIDPALISVTLNEHYQGRSCKVWTGLLDDNHKLIADPILVFWGRMDTMDVDIGETATITVAVESRLADWDRPRSARLTNEEQQARYPGDRGLEFVQQVADQEIRWGV